MHYLQCHYNWFSSITTHAHSHYIDDFQSFRLNDLLDNRNHTVFGTSFT